MTDIDILKSIAENLSERKSSAALNNYQVLCNNIEYVNDLFDFSIKSLSIIQGQVENTLKNDELVKDELINSTKPLYYFRQIIPRILLNDISISEKFLAYTRPDVAFPKNVAFPFLGHFKIRQIIIINLFFAKEVNFFSKS